MSARGRDTASRRARRPLTPGDVVAAGVELLDDVGLAGFTTRALADRLGTYPATLYWHVGNRSQVLAAIVEHVLGKMNVEDPRSAGWKEWLRHASGEYRRVVHAHPHLAPVLVSQLVVNAPATRLVETVLAVLDGAGFRGQDLAWAFNAYVGSLVGWVSVELAASPPDIGEDWRDVFASTVLSLPAEEFPVIAANREYLADSVFTLRWHGGAERPLDASFEAAVEMWIEGLAARLERARLDCGPRAGRIIVQCSRRWPRSPVIRTRGTCTPRNGRHSRLPGLAHAGAVGRAVTVPGLAGPGRGGPPAGRRAGRAAGRRAKLGQGRDLQVLGTPDQRVVDHAKPRAPDLDHRGGLRRPMAPGKIRKMLGPRTGIRAVVIHHQDMRRAPEVPPVVPGERVRAALDVVLTPRGSTNLGSCQRAAGLRLQAHDIEWSWGSGPEVTGTAEAILMAVAGRPAALADLSGDGLPVLAGRVTQPSAAA